jgi:hypothetical protein
MNEADRRAREQAARQRAEAEARQAAGVRDAADRKRQVERDIHALVAQLLPLLEWRDLPGLVPLRIRTPRVPGLRDIFGERDVVRGGWELGAFGHQSLALLGNGDLIWDRRVAKVPEFEHCAELYLRNLRALHDWVVADDPAAPFEPVSFDPRG